MKRRLQLAVVLAALVAGGLVAKSGHATTSDRCVAVDGDTLSCLSGKRRIHLRLNGIDAPELAGHCRAPRVCVSGDPLASKANLKALIAGKTVTWRSLGKDKYGRTLALPKAGGVDLSCAQWRGGYATYKGNWDNGHRLARLCKGMPVG